MSYDRQSVERSEKPEEQRSTFETTTSRLEKCHDEIDVTRTSVTSHGKSFVHLEEMVLQREEIFQEMQE